MKKERPAVSGDSEWRLILGERWLFSLVTWLPLLLFVLAYAIFYQGLPRDLPIGVVDLDNSRLSRMMIRTYDASPTLAVTATYPSESEGIEALRGVSIYGLVVIGPNTMKHVILGEAPTVEAFYNSQYLLIGKLVKSALSEAHLTANARVELLMKLASGSPSIGQALASAVPVGTQVTALYNANRNYAQFLVSAIIPSMWQIFIVIATVYSMVVELRRHKGVSRWLGIHPLKKLFAKLYPYTFIFWLHGLLFLTGMFALSGWPMHGSFLTLVSVQLLTVCACQAVGALFFFLTRDAARGLSTAAAFTAPGLAFMGVTFPATDMILPARIWRSLLPASHYIDIQIDQANYGVSLINSQGQILALLLFVIPGVLACLLAYVMRERREELA